MSVDAPSPDLMPVLTRASRRLGLRVDQQRLTAVGTVLHRRLLATGRSIESYLEELESDSGANQELRRLASELTVSETYFFRDMPQFTACDRLVLLPRLSSGRSVSLLCAGCSSGDEAYSLAILARERIGKAAPTRVSILGVDVNPEALGKAAQGCYNPWSLRATPSDLQQKWFRLVEGRAILDSCIRSAARFRETNLVSNDPVVWGPERYDAVFCRNVLMYMTPADQAALIARIAESLVPGGYLFTGHAESLRGVSPQLRSCHSHDVFFYRKTKNRAALQALSTAAEPPESASTGNALWAEAIQRVSERIAELTQVTARASEAPPAGSDAAATQRATALELCRQERYAEALDTLATLDPHASCDRDTLLMRAVLLAHENKFGLAEQCCRRLLDLDPLHAGAFYVLALCCEGAGDHMAAAENDCAAICLAPTFAMPRLHLGVLARRMNDFDTARQALKLAVDLLKCESETRLALYAGGFSRQGLIRVCEAELARLGVR